ncbi:MAG TPA: hypothetical protein DDZ51_18110 [Planctomycetaceae bacterium]|nr:hypothetical protein [Planctomycetaceae bacterium]
MNHFQFIWTHLSFTLIAASGMIVGVRVLRFAAAKLRPRRLRLLNEDAVLGDRSAFAIPAIVAIVISAALSAVPLGGVDLSGHLLAYSGELSFATIFFLAVTIGGKVARGGHRSDLHLWYGPQWAWTIGGLAIYSVALSGRGPDLYSLGYGSTPAWILLAISGGAAIAQRWMVASLALGIILAWQFRFSGAVNLWDYAIDPFIFAGAAVQTLARVGSSFAKAGTKRRGGRKLVTESSIVVTKAA